MKHNFCSYGSTVGFIRVYNVFTSGYRWMLHCPIRKWLNAQKIDGKLFLILVQLAGNLEPQKKINLYVIILQHSCELFTAIDYVLRVCQKVCKAIPVTARGGLQGCEMLRIPHFLDNRLSTPQNPYKSNRHHPILSL
jgi:hypothetical protein